MGKSLVYMGKHLWMGKSHSGICLWGNKWLKSPDGMKVTRGETGEQSFNMGRKSKGEDMGRIIHKDASEMQTYGREGVGMSMINHACSEIEIKP